MTRYLWPSQQVALLVVGAVVIGSLGVHYVGVQHENRQARQAVCRAELKALTARNLYVERYLMPADACRALALVR
jgi:cytidine deaminase